MEYLEGEEASVPVAPSIKREEGMAQAGSMASLASIAEDVDVANPEADSYGYIENVLEALAVLGRLGGALEKLSQRVANEVRTLIDATLDEVEERIEQRRSEAQDEYTAPRLATLEMGASPQHAAVLRDLFWTLYSKLAAVLEAHRIVYEVARWISSVSTFQASLTLAPRVSRCFSKRVHRLDRTRARDLQARTSRCPDITSILPQRRYPVKPRS